MTPRHSPNADARRRLRDADAARLAQSEWLPPAPTKLQQTDPSLTDRVRSLFEDTVLPVRDIARIAGVAECTIYRYARKGQWRLRHPKCAAGGQTHRGRVREPRLPQPRGAGGRFIPPADAGKPHPTGLKALDPQGAASAIVACEQASALAHEAFARALAFNDAERQARIFALLVRAMRDLAMIADRMEDGEGFELANSRTRNFADLKTSVLERTSPQRTVWPLRRRRAVQSQIAKARLVGRN